MMKEQIKILVSLQNIERESTNINSKLNEVSTRVDMLESRLSEVEDNVENETVQLENLQKQYREFESDAQMNLSQVQKSREKLRSVKTNKEYQSILKEIEDIQNKNSLVEDEMITCLERMDDAEKVISLKKEEFVTVKDYVGIEKESIARETDQNKKRLAELEAKWKEITAEIDSELIRKYTTVKEKVKSRAVVAVKNAVCQGCNLNIPLQLYNDLQRFDDLKFCPHCQRIIYWEE
jgi:predicted  nucleic acid-binding Zn-ribbon protein